MSFVDALKRLFGGASPRPATSAPEVPAADVPMPSEDAVRDALATVVDPEAGLNVVDLGLVYSVEVAPEGIHVALTMTSPACPATGQVADEARAAVRRIAPRDARVTVEVVWDPPWTPDRMSELARTTLGWTRR